MAQAEEKVNELLDDDSSNDVEFAVLSDKASVGLDAARRVIEMYTIASSKDNFSKFTIALSGGSFPSIFGQGLLAYLSENPSSNIDLSKWHIFFADERVVPLDNDDSSFKACKAEIFDKLNSGDKKVILDENLHSITLDNDSYKAAIDEKEESVRNTKLNELTETVRQDYNTQISTVFGGINLPELPVFDCIFLGMGPDGHTASLFPGDEYLSLWNNGDESKIDSYIISVNNSPKPPPHRITMTKDLICNSNNIVFVVTGDSKNEAVKDIYTNYHSNEKQTYPAGIITQYAKNNVVWLLDDGAAKAIG